MAEKLYIKVKLRDGSKGYVPLVRGAHCRYIFKQAAGAQMFSETRRARLQRLRKAEQHANPHEVHT